MHDSNDDVQGLTRFECGAGTQTGSNCGTQHWRKCRSRHHFLHLASQKIEKGRDFVRSKFAGPASISEFPALDVSELHGHDPQRLFSCMCRQALGSRTSASTRRSRSLEFVAREFRV